MRQLASGSVLVKNGRLKLQAIDMDALRCKIMGMKNEEPDGGLRGTPFDTEDVVLCCSFKRIRGL